MKKYKFTINGNTYDAEILSVEEQVISLELNGTPYQVTVDKAVKQTKTPKVVIQAAPAAVANDVPKTAPAGSLSEIKSPLPGTILELHCKVGDTVAIGQKVLMLEAMKMENNIESDKAGVVKEIKVGKGDAVMEGDVLIVIG
jgi:biotin carboxyl carrier protein